MNSRSLQLGQKRLEQSEPLRALESNQPVFPSSTGPRAEKKHRGVESNMNTVETVAKKKRKCQGKSWGREEKNQEISQS